MPEEEKIEQAENTEQAEAQPEGKKKKAKGSMVPWIIMFAVVIISSGAGLGLSFIFAVGSTEDVKDANSKITEEKTPTAPVDETKTWNYPMEDVIANLNDPSATRFVRVKLVLEFIGDQTTGEALMAKKTPLLKSWLNIYFSGLELQDVNGDKNKRRIQLQILDEFNEKLFPGAQPMIKSVYFGDFQIQ